VSPNPYKEARRYEADYVRMQLRVGGVIEALSVIKLGYPTR